MMAKQIGPGECHDLIVALRANREHLTELACQAAWRATKARKSKQLDDHEDRILARCTDPDRARKMLAY